MKRKKKVHNKGLVKMKVNCGIVYFLQDTTKAAKSKETSNVKEGVLISLPDSPLVQRPYTTDSGDSGERN